MVSSFKTIFVILIKIEPNIINPANVVLEFLGIFAEIVHQPKQFACLF